MMTDVQPEILKQVLWWYVPSSLDAKLGSGPTAAPEANTHAHSVHYFIQARALMQRW